MVDSDLLHRELAQLGAGFDAQTDLHDGLHRLTLTAAAALDVDGAGITIRLPGAHVTQYLTATDPKTMDVERRQDELQEGACIDAITHAEIVAVADLAEDPRWPRFNPVLLGAGFRGAAGVPIPFDGHMVGALNLYTAATRAWTTEDFSASSLIADLAAGYLINRHLLNESRTLTAQLQEALESRIVIEQAKGMLSAAQGISPDAAFEVLRSFSRSKRLRIREVAQGVISGDTDVQGAERTGAAGESPPAG